MAIKKTAEPCKAMSYHLMFCKECVRHYLHKDIDIPDAMPVIDPSFPWEERHIEREQ